MGDFNSSQGSAAMEFYTDIGFVYVANSSGQAISRIDHILYRPASRWRVLDSEENDSYSASDHPAVWAQMELIDPIGTSIQENSNSTVTGKLKAGLNPGWIGIDKGTPVISINGRRSLSSSQSKQIYWIDVR